MMYLNIFAIPHVCNDKGVVKYIENILILNNNTIDFTCALVC